jgi:cation:H+ antiporter
MLTYILFAIGFVLLIKGADLLVDGAASISRKLGVSTLVIGLTVVSFGTSAPELVVNVLAGLQGASDIGIGNVLGSNIANILLILGVASVIHELKMHKGLLFREIPFSLLAIAVLFFMANDQSIALRSFNEIDRVDGLVMLSIFSIFMYYLANSSSSSIFEPKSDVAILPVWKSILFMVLGIAGLGFGGKWIVDGAVLIAQNLGLSENFIGLTIVAIGTSLPELVTSAVAAYKKQVDLAIGNVVGSNIFNIFFILGISSLVSPITFKPEVNNIDLLMVVVATIIFITTVTSGKKHVVQKWNGYTYLALYVVYTAFLIWRG